MATPVQATDAEKDMRRRAKGIARAFKRMDSKRALSSSKLQVCLSPIKETRPTLAPSASSTRSILSTIDLIDFDEDSLHGSVLDDDLDPSEFSELSSSMQNSYNSTATEDEANTQTSHSFRMNNQGGAPAALVPLLTGHCKAGKSSTTITSERDKLNDDSSACSIPPELLMEDPFLTNSSAKAATTTNGRWLTNAAAAAAGMTKTSSGRWASDHSTSKKSTNQALVMPVRDDSLTKLPRQDSWSSAGSMLSSSGDSVDTFVLSKATRLL